MSSFYAYPSIYSLGHSAIKDLLTVPVLVEEKIDGSQFSFGRLRGELQMRSKGKVFVGAADEGMFEAAVAVVEALAESLHEGWTYRAEYLSKPKHNALAYGRVPECFLIVFDINTGLEEYLPYDAKCEEAARLGLEVVPRLFCGHLNNVDFLRELLQRESVLGGVQVEGVVIKPRSYDLFGRDKKVLMGKYVSEAFKEKHAKEWKISNPTGGDVLLEMGMRYKTEARWLKAVQHLREAGKLEDSPKDIGALLREIPADIEKECEAEIKEKLYQWAWPRIRREVTRGFPEFYKGLLMAKQFEGGDK